ncbi:MAG: RnfABCDGE type electron transport complex subunit D [Planctomycetes bacterium]|nr:RnfABCDGE type electron transport complex subunit D [Planctomycetota bacterium]
MSSHGPRLLLQAAPFLHGTLTTPKLMREVVLATVPVIAAAAWFFGITALLVVAATTAGAVATERWLGRGARGASLRDNSALLTGILLALTLPPSIPLWMAFLGGAFGIAAGKLAFGGLGHNLFNPALVGRAFLQAAFPTALTTWIPPGGGFFALHASTFAWPMMRAPVDGITGPTPLSRLEFEHVATEFAPLLIGDVAGSLGETSAVVLLLCGLWLGLRRAFDWRIPVAVLGSVLVCSTALWAIDPARYATPWFTLASGGLLFGTVFMATDPVSSPVTPRGAWSFGVGIGVLVVLIRTWGGLQEGVMYAILLMNAATPLIERVAQPRAFGRRKTA